MEEKLKKLISDIKKLIDKLDESDVLGPVGYLEEAIENIESAMEEWNYYVEEQER